MFGLVELKRGTMKKWILLLLCITGSVTAMDLGQSFYMIHTFLQKIFSKKRQMHQTPVPIAKKDNPEEEEIDIAQVVRNYAEFIKQTQQDAEQEKSAEAEETP